MNIATAAQMRAIDRTAIEERGIAGLTLMDRAGGAVFDRLRARLGTLSGKKITLCCGAGKNGGDGFAVGRLLCGAGASVHALLVASPERLAPDTRALLVSYLSAGGRLTVVSEPSGGEPKISGLFSGADAVCPETLDNELFSEADAVVDAMFGIGFHGALRSAPLAAAERMNACRALKVAVDLPSGVETDTGRVEGAAVRADETVTFTLPKPGNCLLPGSLYGGRLTVADIGIPADLAASVPDTLRMTDEDELDRIIPRRRADAHKGDFGRVLIVGGSAAYAGSVYFAAQAAVVGGAGLVTAAVPESVYPILASKLNEAMPRRIPEDSEGRLAAKSLPALLELLCSCDAVLIGPGLSRSPALSQLVCELLRAARVPVVLDADGINAVCAHIDVLRDCSHPVILTPHDGEFARLAGAPPPPGGPERVDAAREFAAAHRCILVLKGHRTLICTPEGRTFVNMTGNPGMAKGGSGDVLAGLLASFLGQGIRGGPAAAAAVRLHGAAGDDCANRIGEYGMTPSDLLTAIPGRLRKYNSREW